MDRSLPGSSVHGILQSRIPEWVAIPFSSGSSQSRDQSQVSCIAGRYFMIWTNLVVQLSSVSQSCSTLCDTMDYTTPGFPVHHQLLELIQTHVHRVCDAIQPFHPLLSPSPPTFSLSQHQHLSLLCIRCPTYWTFSFSISLSNEYLGLISFRMDWLDLLAVQGTLKSLLQNHSAKASVLWHSSISMVQLSHSSWLLEKKMSSLHFSSAS